VRGSLLRAAYISCCVWSDICMCVVHGIVCHQVYAHPVQHLSALHRFGAGCMRRGNGNAGQQMHASHTLRYTTVLLGGIHVDSLSVPANIPLDCVCLFVLDCVLAPSPQGFFLGTG